MSSRIGMLRSVVLVVWTAFFAWLLFTDEVRRYIGSRTYWVVVFGLVALSSVSVLRLLSRSTTRETGDSREAVSLVALLLPVLIVAAVPSPSLGALAVSKKSTGGIVAAVGSVQPPTSGLRSGEKISLEEVEFANQSSEYAEALGITAGTPVKLLGFVTHPKKQRWGDFTLARFAIFCCAADAVPYRAEIDAQQSSADFADDTWLEVTGQLVESPSGFAVEASAIKEVPEPKNPYI